MNKGVIIIIIIIIIIIFMVIVIVIITIVWLTPDRLLVHLLTHPCCSIQNILFFFLSIIFFAWSN